MENVTINAREFLQLLKKEGMVIGPETAFKQNSVEMSLVNLQKTVLRKRMLSLADIHQAKLWGDIDRKTVYHIVRKLVPEKEIIKNPYIKINRTTALSIAASRGFFYET